MSRWYEAVQTLEWYSWYNKTRRQLVDHEVDREAEGQKDNPMQPTYGPIAQIRHATRNPSALALGGVLGAFMPLASFYAVHDGELIRAAPGGGGLVFAPYTNLEWLLVLGGLTFSAKTVTAWTQDAFGDWVKALGFVMMLEGSLLLHPTPWLRQAALAMLCAINAIATGCLLALRDRGDSAQADDRADEDTQPVDTLTVQAIQVTATRHQPEVTARQPVPQPAALPAHNPQPEVQPAANLPARVEQVDASSAQPADEDPVYTAARGLVRSEGKVSLALLRSGLDIGGSRAAKLVEQLQRDGIVSQPDERGRRVVLSA